MAGLDSFTSGVYLDRPGGPLAVALGGDPVPGAPGLTFTSFGGVAATTDRVLFAAATSSSQTGLFLWDHGTLRKVVLEGDPNPDGDVFESLALTLPAPMGLGRTQVVFQDASTGMFLEHNGTVTTLLHPGDATPLGGTYTIPSAGQPMSLFGRTAVFESQLSAGAGVADALLRVSP